MNSAVRPTSTSSSSAHCSQFLLCTSLLITFSLFYTYHQLLTFKLSSPPPLPLRLLIIIWCWSWSPYRVFSLCFSPLTFYYWNLGDTQPHNDSLSLFRFLHHDSLSFSFQQVFSLLYLVLYRSLFLLITWILFLLTDTQPPSFIYICMIFLLPCILIFSLIYLCNLYYGYITATTIASTFTVLITFALSLPDHPRVLSSLAPSFSAQCTDSLDHFYIYHYSFTFTWLMTLRNI